MNLGGHEELKWKGVEIKWKNSHFIPYLKKKSKLLEIWKHFNIMIIDKMHK